MELVKPKVYLIAKTELVNDNVVAWLKDLGGEECLAHITGNDIEQLIELSARRCYKSYAPGLNPNVSRVRKDSRVYHDHILESGHGSVDEHASVTFAFENVSRVTTHELVRHRAGTAMSQESLRYVRLDNLGFWLPSIFEGDDPNAVASRNVVMKVLNVCEAAQKELADIWDINNIKSFDTKKELTSAFRRLAPDGLATGIVFTFNMRALRHVIEKRTSGGAEEEIRLVFGQVAEIMMKECPYIFGDFEKRMEKGLYEYVPKYYKV